MHMKYETRAEMKKHPRTIALNIWDVIEARAPVTLPSRRYDTKDALRLDLRMSQRRRFPLERVKQADENKLLQALWSRSHNSMLAQSRSHLTLRPPAQ